MFWRSDSKVACCHFSRRYKQSNSEFEDAIRASENLIVILPSLDDIKDAISLAKSWLLKSKLQGACSTFQWCVKALSFSSTVPSIEEIEKSLEIAGRFPTIYASCRLYLHSLR
nr:Lysine-specific demethylase rbr-2 [Ipomoea batatas]